jgi:hypothetical protein
MADQKKEQSSAENEISGGLERLGDLLDPHLEARSERNSRKSGRWPLRRTAIFVIGVSAVLWCLILAAAYFLFP